MFSQVNRAQVVVYRRKYSIHDHFADKVSHRSVGFCCDRLKCVGVRVSFSIQLKTQIVS